MGKRVRTKEQRRVELGKAMGQLDAGVREVFESGRWEHYLEVMSWFHRYSANNLLLIAMQMPTATAVASYTDWKRKFGGQVRKGERGIRILAPVRYRKKAEDENGDGAYVERQPGRLQARQHLRRQLVRGRAPPADRRAARRLGRALRAGDGCNRGCLSGAGRIRGDAQGWEDPRGGLYLSMRNRHLELRWESWNKTILCC